LLLEPAKDFWSVMNSAPNSIRHAQSITYWWLLGLPLESIALILSPGRRGQKRRKSFHLPHPFQGEGALTSLEGALTQVEETIASFIKHMMKRKRFALWALGSNLVPACSNRNMARVAALILSGKPLPRDRPQRDRLTRAEATLFQHPYVRAQFRTGRRTHPVDRPLYSPGIIWSDMGERREWESEASLGAQAVLTHRKTLAKEPYPPWLHLPLY
jgi:hypothetical protein